MNIDTLIKHVNEAIHELASQVNRGFSEPMRRHLAARRCFPHYTKVNRQRIHSQMPSASHVAGYTTWRKLSRRIRRGERPIRIELPATVDAGPVSQLIDNWAWSARRASAFVYDISQTEGAPLPPPTIVCGDPGAWLDHLTAWLKSRGMDVLYSPYLSDCEGFSAGGSILIQQGMSPARQFAALAHEVAHQLLHQSRASRSWPRSVREIEAEAVAYAVCSGVGLYALTASSDYILYWGGDVQHLRHSARRIGGSALLILTGLTQRAGSLRHRRAVA